MVSIPQAPPIPNVAPPKPTTSSSGNTPAPINPFESPSDAPNPFESKPKVNPFQKATSTLQNVKGKLAGNHKKVNAIAKYAAMTLITVFIVGYVSLQAVLDENNSYLGIFGVRESTTSENTILQDEKNELQLENSTLIGQNTRIQQQIDEDNFYIHADTIASIQQKQRDWSDTITPEGDPVFGLLDLPNHLTRYFNEGNHDHEILFSNGSNIAIRNFTVERDRTTFTIYAANFFGNVFLLSSEITEIINGLPEFKDGKILSYSRVKERTGNDAMSFTLTVENQVGDIADNADNNPSSQKFQLWFEEQATKDGSKKNSNPEKTERKSENSAESKSGKK